MVLLNLLYHWTSNYPSSLYDKDLLLDASLLLWELAGGVFNSVVSQDQMACKHMLENPEVSQGETPSLVNIIM